MKKIFISLLISCIGLVAKGQEKADTSSYYLKITDDKLLKSMTYICNEYAKWEVNKNLGKSIICIRTIIEPHDTIIQISKLYTNSEIVIGRPDYYSFFENSFVLIYAGKSVLIKPDSILQQVIAFNLSKYLYENMIDKNSLDKRKSIFDKSIPKSVSREEFINLKLTSIPPTSGPCLKIKIPMYTIREANTNIYIEKHVIESEN